MQLPFPHLEKKIALTKPITTPTISLYSHHVNAITFSPQIPLPRGGRMQQSKRSYATGAGCRARPVAYTLASSPASASFSVAAASRVHAPVHDCIMKQKLPLDFAR